ncbi:OsmC family protein [Polaromonas sp.]|jgi:uncharacterized OsmC-like protein|uniref:OsmC family protein n=1 Tax=Polaromonas sp. TaxID=1869339 RepID=UPI0037C6D63A
MAAHDIATALQRVESVLRRRPEAGLHEDLPALARWQGGFRVVATHASGVSVATDMPGELGGTADQATPGWLVRAGIASCTATSIALAAASEGIVLGTLEVQVVSDSDVRGLLGMSGAGGEPVDPGPSNVRMCVRISAPNVPAERLRALVERGNRNAPMSAALKNAVPMDLQVEIGA